jgi:phosphate transport system permease protein
MEEKSIIHASHNLVAPPADVAVDVRELDRSLRRPRTFFSFLLSALTTVLTLVALFPLFSVLYMLLVRGMHHFSFQLFTSLPPSAGEEGGGFGNAIVGTLVMVAVGAVLSVPIGIVAAVFLAEVGPGTRLAYAVRFGAKLLSGFPSILAGVFAYGAVVLLTGKFSPIAGGVALSILMLPTVLLTAEDAIRMVPNKLREAAVGMGATRTQAIWHVVLPSATPGILTGVMLAVARAAGETAPLLFTAVYSNYWYWPVTNGRFDPLQPMHSLAVLIYLFSGAPADNQIEMAWAAALVLVALVLATNLIGQALSRRSN